MGNEPIRKISSHYVLTPQGFLSKGILSFDSEGTLTEISTVESVDGCEQVEFFNGILIPAFVNAHCHLELSYLHDRITPGCGFAGFAEQIARTRIETDLPTRLAAAQYRDIKMFSDGISAVGDISNSDSTFALKSSSKIQYHTFVEHFGLSVTDFSPVERVEQAAASYNLSVSATPHSTYSIQDAPFKALAARSRLLSIHFMESRAESKLYEQRGTLYERNRQQNWTCDFTGYGTPTGRLLRSVPRDKDILLVHNTFITDEDVDLIEGYFTGRITWVLCPRSNRFIENAAAPVDMLHRKGVHIAVGTDSLASNHSLSLIDELKEFSRSIPLEERLLWATRNGAETLAMDDTIGTFEVGKRPGAVLINNIDWHNMSLTAESQSRRIL